MQTAEEKGSQEETETVIESLESVTDVTHNEAVQILQQHKQRMDEHQGNHRGQPFVWRIQRGFLKGGTVSAESDLLNEGFTTFEKKKNLHR